MYTDVVARTTVVFVGLLIYADASTADARCTGVAACATVIVVSHRIYACVSTPFVVFVACKIALPTGTDWS